MQREGGCGSKRLLLSLGMPGAGWGHSVSAARLQPAQGSCTPELWLLPLPKCKYLSSLWLIFPCAPQSRGWRITVWLQHFHPWHPALCERCCTWWGRHSLPLFCWCLLPQSPSPRHFYCLSCFEPRMVSLTSVRFCCAFFLPHPPWYVLAIES